MVVEVAKLARETVITCGPREGPLLADLKQQAFYHEAVKSLFSSFARCLQQLAFSGSEDTIEDELAPIPPLGSHVYRTRDSKIHGPVSLIYRICKICYLQKCILYWRVIKIKCVQLMKLNESLIFFYNISDVGTVPFNYFK